MDGGLGTELSHDHYTSLYSEQLIQEQDRHRDWHALTGNMIIYLVMMINKLSPGWDQELNSYTIRLLFMFSQKNVSYNQQYTFSHP